MPSESPRESAFTNYTYVDEPEQQGLPFAPVPEGFGSPVIPYRGTVYHGVDPGVIEPVDDSEVEGGSVPVERFVPGEEEITPVPVRIVDTATREFKQWRAWQSSVSALSPQLVGGAKDGRTSLKIRNLGSGGTARIWLGPDTGVNPQTGYPLDGGAEISFTGEAPVWGIAETGTVMLAVLTEFSTSQ